MVRQPRLLEDDIGPPSDSPLAGRGALILSGLGVCFELDRVTFATDLAMAVYGVKADLTDAVPRRFMVSLRLAPA